MASKSELTGACTCGEVKYRVSKPPMTVHCCHCTWCQRETGSAFVINVIVETSEISIERGDTVIDMLPSNSGRGQEFVRCSNCGITLWSYYSGLGRSLTFIRGGTLDDPSLAPPKIHIFTSRKQPWVKIPDNVASVPNYYDRSKYWSAESLERFKKLKNTT